jgi:hypothetical protein
MLCVTPATSGALFSYKDLAESLAHYCGKHLLALGGWMCVIHQRPVTDRV